MDDEPSGEWPRSSEGALGDRALNGAILLASAQGVKFATQLLSMVVLARLLSPHDIGVFAMVMPLAAFVMLFQDLGLAQAVESARAVTPAQATTLFAINLGLSVALAGLFAASAPLIALFYGTSEVIAPTLVLAATIVLSGLATLPFALLVRDLRFAALAVADVAGAVSGVAAAIGIALVWPSPWALVASVVANMAVGLVCGWRAARWRPGRPAPLAEVRPLLHFGRGVIGAGLAMFVTRNADNVLIGRYLGSTPLGYYDRAYKLLLFPVQQLVLPLGRVTLPILARFADAPDRYRRAYLRSLDLILLAGLPAMTVALVMADILVPFVLGERWRPVVPVFRWLGLVGLHLPLTATLPWLLTSQGRTRELARLGLFQAVTSVAGYAAGLRYGVVGVATIYALGDIAVRMPVTIWVTGRRGPVSIAPLLRCAGPHAAGAAMAASAVTIMQRWTAAPPFATLLAATLLCYGISWSIVGIDPMRRPAFVELARLARRLVALPLSRRIARSA